MPDHHTEAALEPAVEILLTTVGGCATGDDDAFDVRREWP
jgi:hypothetical protein